MLGAKGGEVRGRVGDKRRILRGVSGVPAARCDGDAVKGEIEGIGTAGCRVGLWLLDGNGHVAVQDVLHLVTQHFFPSFSVDGAGA